MLAPNTLLQGRYLILRPVGKGGMGAVYEATDTRLDYTIALKETLFTSGTMRRAFEREARLLARLRHPTLPKVSDHFVEDTRQFLVMEFIPGEDLGDVLERNAGKIPSSDIVLWGLRWADQLLDALDYLHTQSPPIMHRDIKPQNLKLTPRGEIVLLDFGLAKGSLAQLSTVATGHSLNIAGFTPNYAPLEQIHGADPDPRSDLYSFAATLYHLLTGRRPPDALSRAAALVKNNSDPLRPASDVNPHIPHAIAVMLDNTLALNIDDRPASAAIVREMLHAALDDAHGVAPRFGYTQMPAGKASSVPGVTHRPPPLPRVLRLSAPAQALFDQSNATIPCVQDDAGRYGRTTPVGTLLGTLQTGSPVLSVAISPDGQLGAMGSGDKTIGLWRLRDGCMSRTLRGHRGSVRSVAFSPDGTLLATGSDDKTIRLWRVSTGELAHLQDTWSHPAECVVFSRDGHMLASGGWGGMVCLWQVEAGHLSKMAHLPTGFVNSIAFSPDGQTLVVGCYDGVLQVWDVPSGQLRQRLEGHTSFVLTVAFSPGGHLVAAGGGSPDIFVWRIRDGRLLDTLRGHSNFVRSLAFSPDGTLLASGSEDKTVRLWRVRDGTHIHTLQEPTGGVLSVAFAPDGHALIAGSHDTKIRVWQVR